MNINTFPREAFLKSAKSFGAHQLVRSAAIVLACATAISVLGMTPANAAESLVHSQTAASGTVELPLPPAPIAPAVTALSTFDSTLFTLMNTRRTAAGLAPLAEVVGLDSVSGTWSNSVVALGRYGVVTANPNVGAQTQASGAPDRTVFAQAVAKWYPQSVKPADAFSVLAQYSGTSSKMMDPAFKYVGVRTSAAADGTSVASLTFTDSADPAQVVTPLAAVTPTGALTAAIQSGSTVSLQGTAAVHDATAPVVVNLVDTLGSSSTTHTVAASAGRFDASIPLSGSGVHSLCATVVNQAADTNLALGCTSARIGAVIGNHDTLRQSGTNLTASGWGYDQGAPTTALRATVTVSGPSGTSTTTVLGNVNRPDIAKAFPDAGPAHGFQVTVPTRGVGVNTMCVTLLAASSTSTSKAFTCKTVTVS